MTTSHVCLTLIASRKVRQELFDYITAQTDLVSGFTASEAAGHGPAIELSSAGEQVKGHADYVLVRIVAEDAHADELLARLRTEFRGVRLVYWIMPVSDFGVIE